MQDIFFKFISPIFGHHKREHDLHLVYLFSMVVFFFQVRCMKEKNNLSSGDPWSWLACQQVLHLGELREVTLELHAKVHACAKGRENLFHHPSAASPLAGAFSRNSVHWPLDMESLLAR